jgi:hypothetical protein
VCVGGWCGVCVCSVWVVCVCVCVCVSRREGEDLTPLGRTLGPLSGAISKVCLLLCQLPRIVASG